MIIFQLLPVFIKAQTASSPNDPKDDPQYAGSCISGKHDFTDTSRFFNMDNVPATGNIEGLDISRYDWTIDYNARLVTPNRNGVK